ncbi:hypothetical protein FRB97_009676 [Tulasnella sp. 331]|nr:hypothetical protein FRB97_009676 [Tulasnella sp. 331]
MGMVFAINPPTTGNTLAAFKARALASAPASPTTTNSAVEADCTSETSAKWGNKYCRGY